MTEHITELILAVGGGGAVSAMLTYFIAKKKSNRVDFELILTTLKSDNAILRKKEDQLSARVTELEKQVTMLQSQIILLESAQMNSPYPMWLKDRHGVMLWINEAYTTVFGISQELYIGNDDISVWGEELGLQYRRHDQWVADTGKVFDGFEDVIITGIKTKIRITKWPRMIGTTIIGIAGQAIPPIKVEESPGMQR